MNYLYLEPFNIDEDSIILIEIARKYYLEPQQLINILRFYNGERLNVKW